MEEFAHRQNVERFERELRAETDPERRRLLKRLLDEEMQQLERARLDKERPL